TDLDDGHVFTLTAVAAPSGKGVASVANNQLVFTPGTDFDHLAAGATEVVTVTYTMQDDQGATSSSTVTITITGTNDAPVAVADSASVLEDAIVTGSVAANDSDVDDGATRTFTLDAPIAGLTLNSDGSYSFNAANSAYQGLAQGQSEVVTASYTVTDDQGATATSTLAITLTGTNDAPVVTSNAAAATGAVVEAGSQNNGGTAAATGTLASSDADSGATASWSGNAAGTYGSFAINAAGVWTYTLDNNAAATQALSEGQVVTETFTATVTDNHGATAQQQVTVQVTGAIDNRAPTVENLTLTGHSGAVGGVGVAISPYNGTGIVFTNLIDTNGDGVADAPESPSTLSGGYGNGLATGDIDGDGDVDVVTANGSEIWSYTNMGDTDGDGRADFVATVAGYTGNSTADVALADLNGDGKLDIVTSAYGVLTENINQGDTNGNGLVDDFVQRNISNGSIGYTYGVTTGDLDGDGRTDVITSNYETYYYGGAPVTISFNRGDTNGDGQIDYVTQAVYSNTSQAMGVSLGDINGDGKMDLVVGRWDNSGTDVLLNLGDTNGDGEVDFETFSLGFNDYVMENTLVDIDGDGDLDIVSSGANGSNVHISINQGDSNGDGGTDFVTTAHYVGYTTYGLAAVDLDGDGDVDILAPNPNGYWSGNQTSYLNNLGDTDGDGAPNFSLVTINGVNGGWDAEPLTMGTGGGSGVREDGPVVTGSFVGADADAGDTGTLVYQILTAPSEGTVVNNGNGTFGFNPGTAFQDLAQGETREVSFTYRAVDTNGAASQPATVTVIVAGANDAPVVSGVIVATAVEDGASVSVDALSTASDVDHGATLSVVVPNTLPGGVTYDAATHRFILNPANAAYQSLAAGQTTVVTLNYAVTDGSASTAAVVQWTVTGTNDAPKVTGAVTANVNEGSTSNLNALGASSDVDSGTTLSVLNVPGTLPAGVTYNAATKTFSINANDAAYNSLAVGQSAVVTVAYDVSDGITSTPASVRWTVQGTNDAPVVTSTAANAQGSVVEAGNNDNGSVIAGTLTATGTLTSSDVDAGATATWSGSTSATYGTFAINAAGVWTYTLDNSRAATQGIREGQSVNDTFVARVTDERGGQATQVVTVSITGTNDTPIAVGEAAGGSGPTITMNFDGTGVAAGFQMPGFSQTGNGYGVGGYTANSGANISYTSNNNLAGGADGILSRTDGADFSLQQMALSAYNTAHQTTITGYRDGVEVATRTVNLTTNGANATYQYGNSYQTFTFGAEWGSVDEVRFYGAGSGDYTFLDNLVVGGSGLTTTENASLSIAVLANDIDPDIGDVLTVVAASVTSGSGSVTIAADAKTILFNPGTAYDYLAVNQTAMVAITYTITDDKGATAVAVANVKVTGTNDVPIAAVDTATTSEDSSITVNVLANDTDADTSDVLTITGATITSGLGTASIVGNQLKYDPGTAYNSLAVGQTATVKIGYNVSDGHGGTTSSVATITVTGANDAPVVSSVVSGTAVEDGASTTLNALATASDVDAGTTLTVTNIGTLPAGVTYDAAAQSFTLNPAAYQALAAGQTSIVTVTYDVTDGTASVATSAKWTVTGTNDAPTVSGAVTGTATEDGSSVTLDALTNASDVDSGNTLVVTNVGTLPAGVTYDAAAHSFTLNPANAAYQSLAAGQTAEVVVSYTVSDGTASVPQTAKWVVTGTNDGPVAVADTNTVTEDATITGSVATNDSDVDSATLTYTLNAPVAGLTINSNGTYSFDAANAAYQSLSQGQTQSVVANYTVIDGSGLTATATLTITVTGTNDGPVAVADTNAVAEDATITGSVAANDSDADSTTLTYSLNAPVTGLTFNADGTYSFNASNAAYQSLAQGQTQNLVANYTVTDSTGLTATSTLTITVTGTNDGPTAAADVASATEDGAVVTGSVAANDSDADAGAVLTYALNAPVAGLTLNADGSYSFDPANGAYQALAAGATQAVVANYTATDQFGATATSTLTVTVTGSNDAPVAVADTAAVVVGVTKSIAVLANDTDADGGALSILSTTAAAKGTVAIVGTEVTYTANAGVSGTDTFTYTAKDAAGATSTATVTVNLDRAPVAVNDTYTINAGATAKLNVTTNDTDPDNDAVTLTAVGSPAHGTVVVNADNTLSYTPTTGYTGADTFTYTISDGKGGTATGTVNLTVKVPENAVAPTLVVGSDTVLVPTEGAAMKTSLTLQAGDVVTFDWNFTTDDYAPYKDFAFATVNASTYSLSNTQATGDYGATGWNTFTFTAPTAGTYVLGQGVMNDQDASVESYLAVDAIRINGAVVQSFETGFGTTTVTGQVTRVTSGSNTHAPVSTMNPTNGSYEAFLVSQTTTTTNLESFLGLTAGSLANVAKSIGKEYQPIIVPIGVKIAANAHPDETYVTISGAPVGSVFNHGVYNSVTNTWKVDIADLGGNLTITAPSDYTGSFTLTVVATSKVYGSNTTANSAAQNQVVNVAAASVEVYAPAAGGATKGGTLADVLHAGAGLDVLTGGTGNDTFVFTQGQANGDRIVDFGGNGAAAGDSLRFEGYGAGATFTQIDANHWQVNYNGGTSHEVITFDNGAAIDASDYSFTAGTSGIQSLTAVTDENLLVVSVASLEGEPSAGTGDDAQPGQVSNQSGDGSAVTLEENLASVSISTLYDSGDESTVSQPAGDAPALGEVGRPTLDGARIQSASAGADTLQGTSGNDVFVFHAGTTDGDHVLDFSGLASGGGDKIEFVGFGEDAIFTKVDETHWQVDYNAGAQHEVITFENAAPINTQDFTFV
ncbi:MAG: tandem-95 repeat protein, partial [Sphingomonadales bacterium]